MKMCVTYLLLCGGSTRRTRLSATPNLQMQMDVYKVIANNAAHDAAAQNHRFEPNKMRALLEML